MSGDAAEGVPDGNGRSREAEGVVLRFNDAINGRDLDGLAELMTDDHTLITGEDEPVSGKSACLRAWARFFELFPDYRNEFVEVRPDDAVVRVRGRAVCSDERLDGPALWTAVVEARRVQEWRVREDTPENRRGLGFDRCEE